MMQRFLRFVPLLAMATFVHAQEQWTLTTRDTSLTLAVNANQPTVTSLSSAGGAPKWVQKPVPVALPDHVFRQGQVRQLHWKFTGGVRTPAEGAVTLPFRCEDPKLELLSIWQCQDGPGPIEHHFELVNRSGQVIEVPLLPSLVLNLTAPSGHSLENWWVEKGAGGPSEAGTHREAVKEG